MRIYTTFLLTCFLIWACGSTSTQKNNTKESPNGLLSGKYKNRIYSPDNTKYIEIFKNGSLKGEAITQVYIHYPHGASQVFSCKGIDKDLKVEWTNDNEINIISSTEYEVIHKETITHLFEEDVSVTYSN